MRATSRSILRKLLPYALACMVMPLLIGLKAPAQTPAPAPAPQSPVQDTPISDTLISDTPIPDAPIPGASTTGPAQSQAPSPVTPVSSNPAPGPPITILEDTLIRVMTTSPISSNRDGQGTPVLFTLSEDVTVAGQLAIPRGAAIHGIVVKSKKAGVLAGSPELTLQLTSLDLGGRSYPLYTYLFKAKGMSKTLPTETKALHGAAIGAIVGVFAGGEKGGTSGAGKAVDATAGAALGAGVGTIVSAATPGPLLRIPSESQVDFYLASPITVTPVSAKEAARLSQGLHPGGPKLYVRSENP